MLDKIRYFFKRLFAKKVPMELSFSRISAYRFCPYKYHLIYNQGMKTAPTPQGSLGQTVHRTLEDYHKSDGQTLDDLLEIYNRVWVNEGFVNPQQTMQYFEKGEKMLVQYFEWSQLRKSEIVAVEKEFRFAIGNLILRGIIDRIDKLPDDTYEVIDYKTHAEMWDQAKIDSDLQLTLYAMGCENIMKVEPALLSYYFLAHNQVVSTSRSQIDKDEAIKILKDVAKKLEKKDFSPDLSKCPRCDFKAVCKFSTAKSANESIKVII